MPDFRFRRLLLRVIERTDLPDFLRFLQDLEVVQHLGAPVYPTNMDDELRWYEDTIKLPLREHPMAICIEDPLKSGWRLIGNCSFKNFNDSARHAELGLLIGEKSEWNKGYGTEAMQALQWLGFSEMNLNRLYLRVAAENLGAIRAYEKAGFTHEGRLRQERYFQGRYGDMLVMSVLRQEWHLKQQAEKGKTE